MIRALERYDQIELASTSIGISIIRMLEIDRLIRECKRLGLWFNSYREEQALVGLFRIWDYSE